MASQACVVGRKVSNNVNFAWKSGQNYKFTTGYKLYADATATEPLEEGDGYFQNFVYEFSTDYSASGAYSYFTATTLAATSAMLAIL